MPLLLALAASYLVGSIPTSFIFGKLKGIDIRKRGSGNVGATNVYRVVGKLPGLLVLILDVLKGVIALTFITDFFFKFGVILDYDIFRLVMALAVVVGHDWTVFLNFKGGKGVATSLGVLLALWPLSVAFAVTIWIITVCITKYVSLASILVAIAIPIIAAVAGKPIEFVVFTIILALICVHRHRSNIKRLLNGKESKFSVKR